LEGAAPSAPGRWVAPRTLRRHAEPGAARSRAPARSRCAPATNLARLWRDQGKRAEARDLLAPVYGWFAEGFDTQALIDAKALLEELSG